MFSLAEKVNSAHIRIRLLVRHDQYLRRTSKQINPDVAEKLLLRFRDKCITRTSDKITDVDSLCTKRHSSDRLHATEKVDVVRASHVHRRDSVRRDLSCYRRRACDYVWYTRDFGGQDRHVCAGE